MLMCYLRVCPFTKPIGQDCTVEKRADQCCPIVTCPDVPVDLLTSTSTSSPAEYGGTGVGKYDRYGCSINGRYFPEGSKVPPTPNKPCEHCYCIRNMTTCVMQECTLHVDGCTPIYHKDVCCPVRYSCDHPEDEIPLLDDMSTTVRPTPGFLLTTTTIAPVTQASQSCVHDDKIFVDGALIKTEKACEHCYCMKGDIVCVVQECGTPMENEGKNCTSLAPREGQCCPDTYICEGDELSTEVNDFTTEPISEDFTTLPSRRVSAEGSGYRKETDNFPYTEPSPLEFVTEGSGDTHLTTEKSQEEYQMSTSTEIIDKTKSPVTENVEIKQTTPVQKEYNSVTDSNILEETTIGNVEPIDAINVITESYETDPSVATTLTSTDTDVKIKPTEGYSTEKVIQKETIPLEKDVSSLVTMPTVAEKETTNIEDNLKETTESEKVDLLTTNITSSPFFEETEMMTTESYREKDVYTGVSEQEASVSNAHTSSTPFLEDIEKLSTLSQEEHLITDGLDKKETTQTSTPSVLPEEGTQIKDEKDNNFVESTEKAPLQDLGVLPISGDKETTSIADESYSTTEASEKEIVGLDQRIPTEDQEEIKTETTTLTRETSESEYSTIAPSIGTVTLNEKFDITTESHKHITGDDISEIPDYKKPEPGHITSTLIPTQEDKEITNAELTTESATSSIMHHTTISSDLGTTSQSDQETGIVSQENEAEKHKTEKTPLIDDLSKFTTVPDILPETSKKTDDDLKFEDEEMSITTESSFKDDIDTTSADKQQSSSVPLDGIGSTPSAPFLEEIEKSSTAVPDDHIINDQLTEKDITKPQLNTQGTTVVTSKDIESTTEPDKGLNTIPSGTFEEEKSETPTYEVVTPFKESERDQSTEGIVESTATQMPDSSTEIARVTEENHYAPTTENIIPDVASKVTEHVDLSITPSTINDIDIDVSTLRPTIGNTEIDSDDKNKDISTTSSELQKAPTSTEASIDDLGHLPSSTTESTIYSDKVETTTINQIENEIDENNNIFVGRIPGEGDCLLNSITYKNGSSVPKTNKCHSNCKCLSSIIKCDPIICSSPPEYMDNCQPTYDSPDSCCPTYVCDQSRETMPPVVPLVHVTSTEAQPSFECHGDQCEVKEEKHHSDIPEMICSGSECGDTTSTEQNKCGPNGCSALVDEPINIPSADHSVLCSGKPCKTAEEACANGACQLPTIQVPPEIPCEGSHCDAPSKINEEALCENGEICKDNKVPEDTNNKKDCSTSDCGENIAIPEKQKTEKCQGENCKELDIPIECLDESCRRKDTNIDENIPPLCEGSTCSDVKDVPKSSEHTPYETTPEIIVDHETSEKTVATPGPATEAPVVSGIGTGITLTQELPDSTESSVSTDSEEKIGEEMSPQGTSVKITDETTTEGLKSSSTISVSEDSEYTDVQTKSPNDEIVPSKTDTTEQPVTTIKLEYVTDTAEVSNVPVLIEESKTGESTSETVVQDQEITTAIPVSTKLTEYPETTQKTFEAEIPATDTTESDEDVKAPVKTEFEKSTSSPVLTSTELNANLPSEHEVHGKTTDVPTTEFVTSYSKLPENAETSDISDLDQTTDSAILSTTSVSDEHKTVTEAEKSPIVTTELPSMGITNDIEENKESVDSTKYEDSSTTSSYIHSSTPGEIPVDIPVYTADYGQEVKETTNIPETYETTAADTKDITTELAKDEIPDITSIQDDMKSTEEQVEITSPSSQTYSTVFDALETTQPPKTTKTIAPIYSTKETSRPEYEEQVKITTPSPLSHSTEFDELKTTETSKTTIRPDYEISTEILIETTEKVSKLTTVSEKEEELTPFDHKIETQTTETSSIITAVSESDDLSNVSEVTDTIPTTSSESSDKDSDEITGTTKGSTEAIEEFTITPVDITEETTQAQSLEKHPIEQEKPTIQEEIIKEHPSSAEKEPENSIQFDHLPTTTTLSSTQTPETETTKTKDDEKEFEPQTDKSTQTPELSTSQYEFTDKPTQPSEISDEINNEKEHDKYTEYPSSVTPMSLVTVSQKATEITQDEITTEPAEKHATEKHEDVTGIPEINESLDTSSEKYPTTSPGDQKHVEGQGEDDNKQPEMYNKVETTVNELDTSTLPAEGQNVNNDLPTTTSSPQKESGLEDFTESTLADKQKHSTENPDLTHDQTESDESQANNLLPQEEGSGHDDVTKSTLLDEQNVSMDHTDSDIKSPELLGTTLTPPKEIPVSEEVTKSSLPGEENGTTEFVTTSTSFTRLPESQKTTLTPQQADEFEDITKASLSDENVPIEHTTLTDIQTGLSESQATTQIPDEEEIKSSLPDEEDHSVPSVVVTELPEISTLLPNQELSDTEDKTQSTLMKEPEIDSEHPDTMNIVTELPDAITTTGIKEISSKDESTKSTLSDEQNSVTEHIPYTRLPEDHSTTLPPLKETQITEEVTKPSLTETEQTATEYVSTLDHQSKLPESLITPTTPKQSSDIEDVTKSALPEEQKTELPSTTPPTKESSDFEDQTISPILDDQHVSTEKTTPVDFKTDLPELKTSTYAPQEIITEDLTKSSPSTSLEITTPGIANELPEKEFTQTTVEQTSGSEDTTTKTSSPLKDEIATEPILIQTEVTEPSLSDSSLSEKFTTSTSQDDEKRVTTETIRETTEALREGDTYEKTTAVPKEQVTEIVEILPTHIDDTQHVSTTTETPLITEVSTHKLIPELYEKSTEPPYVEPKDQETTPYVVELEEHTQKSELSTIYSTTQETTSASEKTDEETKTPEKVDEEASKEQHPTEMDSSKDSEETSTQYKIPESTTLSSISEISSAVDDSHKTPTATIDFDQSSVSTTELIYKKETTPTVQEPTESPEKITSTSSKPLDAVHEQDLIPTSTTKTADISEQALEKFTKPDTKPSESPSTELPKPITSETPIDEIAGPEESNFPPSASSGYGGEPDYVEEDQAFGPGTCRYGGKVYVSAQQIPRDDPCDFCFCFRSDIICLQQSCPPPIHGCHEEPIQGFCCPRYECPVSMATTLNVTTTTTTTTTTLPPHFPTHPYKGAAQRRGCQIKGHTYKVGEVVRASSGPCLHCTCGGDGQMKCDPKACTPEPMLRQMIAAAVSAKRRR